MSPGWAASSNTEIQVTTRVVPEEALGVLLVTTLPFSSYVNLVVTPMGSVTEDRRPMSLWLMEVVLPSASFNVSVRPSTSLVADDTPPFGSTVCVSASVVGSYPNVHSASGGTPSGPAATSTSSPSW